VQDLFLRFWRRLTSASICERWDKNT